MGPVSNTPAQMVQDDTYGGGVRSPLIMHWPARLSGGAVQSQYHHAIDVMPTVLELLGIEAPASYRGVPRIRSKGSAWRTASTQPMRRRARSRSSSEIAETRHLALRLEGGHAAQARRRLRDRTVGALSSPTRILQSR